MIVGLFPSHAVFVCMGAELMLENKYLLCMPFFHLFWFAWKKVRNDHVQYVNLYVVCLCGRACLFKSLTSKYMCAQNLLAVTAISGKVCWMFITTILVTRIVRTHWLWHVQLATDTHTHAQAHTGFGLISISNFCQTNRMILPQILAWSINFINTHARIHTYIQQKQLIDVNVCFNKNSIVCIPTWWLSPDWHQIVCVEPVVDGLCCAFRVLTGAINSYMSKVHLQSQVQLMSTAKL